MRSHDVESPGESASSTSETHVAPSAVDPTRHVRPLPWRQQQPATGLGLDSERCLDDRLQLHNVFVLIHLLEEHDLPESALRIGRVLEGIKDLLERNCLLALFVGRLPDDAVSSLAELLGHVGQADAAVPPKTQGSRPSLCKGWTTALDD